MTCFQSYLPLRILQQGMTTKTLKIDTLILPHDAWSNVDFFIIEKTSIYHQVITVITSFLSRFIST